MVTDGDQTYYADRFAVYTSVELLCGILETNIMYVNKKIKNKKVATLYSSTLPSFKFYSALYTINPQ